MAKQVTLTIDGIQVTVPEGMGIVDAAKTVGIDIPVFCHHPKLEPVGMCRMCLVEIGRPVRDRATGEIVMENGVPKIQFLPKLSERAFGNGMAKEGGILRQCHPLLLNPKRVLACSSSIGDDPGRSTERSILIPQSKFLLVLRILRVKK